MRTIDLEHDSRLLVPQPRPQAFPTAEWHVEGATVVSFRKFTNRKATESVGGLNATSRMLKPLGKDIVFYGLETDSQLAPLIIWDAAHTLPLGGTITFAGDDGLTPYLGRKYYDAGFEVAGKKGPVTTYRKKALLPAERDKGLDRWTFGIPTGPGDATGLNAAVKRILELGYTEFEIVLCGRPGPGFKYFNKVRIVGEEYSKPPVMIGLKKNVIAENAKYENLCIIHDRVFLPLDFKAAMESYGDLYPITAFQSFWFDDPYHLIVRRYSDYNRAMNPWLLNAAMENEWTMKPYKQDIFAIQGTGFIYSNPLRYHQGNYCNGSMYIAKKHVWLDCPQSPTLEWAEFEDNEFGERTSLRGIPSRLNPYAFTQSIFARPALFDERVLFEKSDGELMRSVPFFEGTKFRRKPLTKISTDDAMNRLGQFARKRIAPATWDAIRTDFGKPPATTKDWIQQIGVVVYAAEIEFGEEGIKDFTKDYEKLLYNAVFEIGYRRYILESFAAHGTPARDTFVELSPQLSNLLFYRPHQNLFYESLQEYFPEKTSKLLWGTWFTAKRLGKHNGSVFYHPDGQAGFQKAILNSTPFANYYEESA
jgi:hypothetical protein